MISLFGVALSAASPWVLLAIPAAVGLLVYIFRIRGTAHSAVVSSLLFLKELPRRPTGRKVFVPPLQFWLELAILTLLILAASGLLLTRSGKHVAVVVDSSLSMGALYGSGGTRLEQAKRVASLDLSRAPDSTNFTVLSSSSDLTQLSADHDSSSGALAAVKSVTQSHRADALSDHVHTLLLNPTYDSVWVYTDRELSGTQPSPRLIFNQLPIEPATQTNAWIKGVQRLADSTLSVAIGYGGATPRDALVDGECYPEGSQVASKLAAKTVRLSPQETTTTGLASPSSPWSYCRVHVRLQDASLFDSLPLDNEGWISHSGSSSSIRVESSLTPEQLGLTRIHSIAFIAQGERQGKSLPTIFHRQAPPSKPTFPSLVVMPPVGELPWGGRVLERGADGREITRWDDSHPLLTYVKPALVTLREARALECPPSAVPVLFSSSGPVACAGEESGARYVITGFELFPFDGSKNPTMSIFTLNALKWLFQSGGATSGGTLPSTIQLPDTIISAEYLQPAPSTLELHGNALNPKNPGVVLLKNSDGSTKLLALNAFEDEESNLSQGATLSISPQAQAARPVTGGASSQSLLSWLAAIALAVIAADLIRRFARHIRWSDA
jgi:hypothetical protein